MAGQSELEFVSWETRQIAVKILALLQRLTATSPRPRGPTPDYTGVQRTLSCRRRCGRCPFISLSIETLEETLAEVKMLNDQRIRVAALTDAYKVVEEFIDRKPDGTIEWKGSPMRCLTKLRILSDRPVQQVPVVVETVT